MGKKNLAELVLQQSLPVLQNEASSIEKSASSEQLEWPLAPLYPVWQPIAPHGMSRAGSRGQLLSRSHISIFPKRWGLQLCHLEKPKHMCARTSLTCSLRWREEGAIKTKTAFIPFIIHYYTWAWKDTAVAQLNKTSLCSFAQLQLHNIKWPKKIRAVIVSSRSQGNGAYFIPIAVHFKLSTFYKI